VDRPTLSPTQGELFYKLLAVRTQLQLHQTEADLALARAELCRGYHSLLSGGLPPLEAQALAELAAPTGARFNWQTFSYDDPPAEAAPATVA